MHKTHRVSLTAGWVICGQVRLLWPGSPHTAHVLGMPMALSERACLASWSELMRFIDSAMRLLTARRPAESGRSHGAEGEAMSGAFRHCTGLEAYTLTNFTGSAAYAHRQHAQTQFFALRS